MCDVLEDVRGLRVVRPEGSCFMMLDVRGTGLTSQDFSFRLLEEAGVSLLAGEGFGPSGTGFMRLSLTAPDDRLAEACAGSPGSSTASTIDGRPATGHHLRVSRSHCALLSPHGGGRLPGGATAGMGRCVAST